MPRHRHPVCPTHGTRLICPSCAGAAGGRALAGRPLTEAQREARRANALRASAAAAKKRRAERETQR